MIQQLIKDLDNSDKTVINFIFCDNNLLLVKQTSERVQRDVVSVSETCNEFDINGERYIEFSSRNNGKAKRNSGEVVCKILMDDIRNVICCTNGRRASDISHIIQRFNTSPCTQGKFEFKIWLDEADKFTKFIDHIFRPLVDTHNNVHVYCVTATPEKLFKKYSSMNVLPIENTTSPDYHGWEDNIRILVENYSNTTFGFIHYVLTKIVDKNKICEDSKWYIPGDTSKASHQLICDILVGIGFAVFVVNGDGIALTLPTDGRPIFHEEKTEELNKQMMRMYRENNVNQFPMAITGNICVGRGISIMSPEFIFDYAILSICNNKAEASQSSGRVKSNMKCWTNYKPPTVYTTTKFDTIATEWEYKSRNLAELAFKKDDINPSIITKAEFKGIGIDEDKCERGFSVFNTHAENYHFAKTEVNAQRDSNWKKDPNGFKMCTITEPKVHSLEEITKFVTESKMGSNMPKNITKLSVNEYTHRCYVCYENLADNSTARFVTSWVKRVR